jgi:hypothetical protein
MKTEEMKHYSYALGLLHRGKHQVLVPDPNIHTGKVLGLVKKVLDIPEEQYVLVSEDNVVPMVIQLAEQYKKDLANAVDYFSQKETEYMVTHRDLNFAIKSTRSAKQFAVDETLKYLMKQ